MSVPVGMVRDGRGDEVRSVGYYHSGLGESGTGVRFLDDGGDGEESDEKGEEEV